MNNKTRKVFRIVLISIVALLIVAALLYFVPWPTRIDQQMTGAELSADGTVLQECTMTVKGWKLNYLFQKDQIKLETFNVDNLEHFNLPSQRYSALHTHISEDFLYTTWMWGDTFNAQFIVAFLANDSSWLLFRTDGRFFAVSVDGGLGPQAIWETVTSAVIFQ